MQTLSEFASRQNKPKHEKVYVKNLHHGTNLGTRYVRQWEKLMGIKAEHCCNLNCSNPTKNPSLVGAHVKLDDGKHGPQYIIPLCHSCNSSHNNDSMPVYKDNLALLTEVNKQVVEDDGCDLLIVFDKDAIETTAFNNCPQLLFEYKTYKDFPPTKCVYRHDNGNGTLGQHDHIHVYADSKHHNQLYAINIDGTAHDGSYFVLSHKHQQALSAIGFTVPEGGILEWCTITPMGDVIFG